MIGRLLALARLDAGRGANVVEAVLSLRLVRGRVRGLNHHLLSGPWHDCRVIADRVSHHRAVGGAPFTALCDR